MPRITLDGDRATAQSWIKYAKGRLENGKYLASLTGGRTYLDTRILPDGTLLKIDSRFGHDFIYISSPPRAPIYTSFVYYINYVDNAIWPDPTTIHPDKFGKYYSNGSLGMSKWPYGFAGDKPVQPNGIYYVGDQYYVTGWFDTMTFVYDKDMNFLYKNPSMVLTGGTGKLATHVAGSSNYLSFCANWDATAYDQEVYIFSRNQDNIAIGDIGGVPVYDDYLYKIACPAGKDTSACAIDEDNDILYVAWSNPAVGGTAEIRKYVLSTGAYISTLNNTWTSTDGAEIYGLNLFEQHLHFVIRKDYATSHYYRVDLNGDIVLYKDLAEYCTGGADPLPPKMKVFNCAICNDGLFLSRYTRETRSGTSYNNTNAGIIRLDKDSLAPLNYIGQTSEVTGMTLTPLYFNVKEI